MQTGSLSTSLLRSIVLLATAFAFASHSATGQNSGGGVELHAKGDVTAADVGLPAYPGAALYKKPGADSSTVDMGFTFGDVHFRIVAAEYVSADSAARILDFYRKPMARYGEVLECDHGKPVGAEKATRGGLTCSDGQDQVQVNDGTNSSTDHELRAGTPHKFRIVGIGDKQDTSIHFGLVYVELPKDGDGKKSD